VRGADGLDHFEALYRASADPWDYERSRAEAFKRRAVMALLGAPPLGRVLELGCGPGVATAEIAPRCARLLALDGSDAAVRIARERSAGERRVRIRAARLPCPLPPRAFDAALATEVLYYLPREGVRETLLQIRAALRPGGRFVSAQHLERFPDALTAPSEVVREATHAFGPPLRTLVGAGWRADLYRR
jgi:SAM-dependent methyltransferase